MFRGHGPIFIFPDIFVGGYVIEVAPLRGGYEVVIWLLVGLFLPAIFGLGVPGFCGAIRSFVGSRDLCAAWFLAKARFQRLTPI